MPPVVLSSGQFAVAIGVLLAGILVIVALLIKLSLRVNRLEDRVYQGLDLLTGEVDELDHDLNKLAARLARPTFAR